MPSWWCKATVRICPTVFMRPAPGRWSIPPPGADAWWAMRRQRVNRHRNSRCNRVGTNMQNASLEKLRHVVGQCFVAGLWAHVPVIAIVGLANGTAWLAGSVAGAGAAAIATAAWRFDRDGQLARYAITIAQVTMVSLLVWLGQGPLQIEVHFYYFASFAMLAAFCDWP